MTRDFAPTVYLMASRRNGTLYLGVTSNLLQRIAQHRAGTPGGFTEVHKVKILVWFEPHPTMESAIVREKRLKAWKRGWKLDLIETMNPDWRDLATDYGFEALPLDSSVRWNDELDEN
jgi:putative endonuclease